MTTPDTADAAAPMATAESHSHAGYAELARRSIQASLLHATGQLLGWDQEVHMPARGVEWRSRQLAQVARLQHEMLTDERIGELLAECESDDALTATITDDRRRTIPSDTAANLRAWRRDFGRRTKLPPELVEEEARLASVGQHTWAEARKTSDFAAFRPVLEDIVGLLRRKAECFGWAEGGEPWDALAEDYEPGCTAAEVESVFTPLRDRLKGLVAELMDAPSKPDETFNRRALPVDRQQAFVRWATERIGFDYERGRMDVSTHPFCTGTCRDDVRITTRFHDDNLNDALGSSLHEAGHGIYEQGLRREHAGTPMGESVSLGIHESQSRMWENQVGRSLSFWRFVGPHMKTFFGDALEDLPVERLYEAANVVTPDFIRVEADEATYNMHVMIRFELERAILRGDLDVADIPAAWNEKYRDSLGLEVPSDAKGCLQDIHWSMAAMGYFPTYTMGNLYAAQLFEAAGRELGDLDAMFEQGEFRPLRTWLNDNVHAHGRRLSAAELCEHVTGEPLSADPLLRHLEGKLRPIYGL